MSACRMLSVGIKTRGVTTGRAPSFFIRTLQVFTRTRIYPICYFCISLLVVKSANNDRLSKLAMRHSHRIGESYVPVRSVYLGMWPSYRCISDLWVQKLG